MNTCRSGRPPFTVRKETFVVARQLDTKALLGSIDSRGSSWAEALAKRHHPLPPFMVERNCVQRPGGHRPALRITGIATPARSAAALGYAHGRGRGHQHHGTMSKRKRCVRDAASFSIASV